MIKKVISVVLLLSVLFCLCACGKPVTGVTNKTFLNKNVISVDNYDISFEELQLRFYVQYRDYLGTNSAYFKMIGLDRESPLNDQKCYYDQSLSWAKYFFVNAVNDIVELYAVRTAMDNDTSFVIDQNRLDEEVQTCKDNITYYANHYGMTEIEYIKKLYGECLTYDSFVEYYKTSLLVTQYHDYIVDTLEITDEDISAELLSKTSYRSCAYPGVSMRQIQIVFDNTLNEDDRDEAAEKRANEILAMFESGETSEDRFAELAMEYSDQKGAATHGGFDSMFVKGYYVDEISNWLFDAERKPGDYDIVKTTYGYHILYFIDHEEDVCNYNARQKVKAAKYSEWLEDLCENKCNISYDEEFVESMLKYY